MDVTNQVVLRGIVAAAPQVRELPSGGLVTHLELKTPTPSGTCSVPVAVHDRLVEVEQGDDVVVVGFVQRRFFRAGGVTQSRTEVIAPEVIKTSRRKTLEKALQAAAAALSSAPTC
jgi:single-strand DNA-binding protein